MRTVGCACGYQAEGSTDPELRSLIRAHAGAAHPELDISEELVWAWVAHGVAVQPLEEEVMPGERTAPARDG